MKIIRLSFISKMFFILLLALFFCAHFAIFSEWKRAPIPSDAAPEVIEYFVSSNPALDIFVFISGIISFILIIFFYFKAKKNKE